jgi:hypothetical protein
MKLNLEESFLKLFDQRNSKNEANPVEKLPEQINSNFDLFIKIYKIIFEDYCHNSEPIGKSSEVTVNG